MKTKINIKKIIEIADRSRAIGDDMRIYDAAFALVLDHYLRQEDDWEGGGRLAIFLETIDLSGKTFYEGYYDIFSIQLISYDGNKDNVLGELRMPAPKLTKSVIVSILKRGMVCVIRKKRKEKVLKKDPLSADTLRSLSREFYAVGTRDRINLVWDTLFETSLGSPYI